MTTDQTRDSSAEAPLSGPNRHEFAADVPPEVVAASAAILTEKEQDPVTRREWWGWFIYNAAGNAFSLVAMSIFFPLLLVYLATAQAATQAGAPPPPQCNATLTTGCLQCVAGKGQQLMTSTGYARAVRASQSRAKCVSGPLRIPSPLLHLSFGPALGSPLPLSPPEWEVGREGEGNPRRKTPISTLIPLSPIPFPPKPPQLHGVRRAESAGGSAVHGARGAHDDGGDRVVPHTPPSPTPHSPTPSPLSYMAYETPNLQAGALSMEPVAYTTVIGLALTSLRFLSPFPRGSYTAYDSPNLQAGALSMSPVAHKTLHGVRLAEPASRRAINGARDVHHGRHRADPHIPSLPNAPSQSPFPSPTPSCSYTAYDSPNLQAGALSMEPVAYTTVIIGLAVVVQIIGLVCFGAEADFGQGRWRMLLVGTLMGAVPCILCLALTSPSLWWLAGLFAIIANLGYGISLVGYNSYLPVLVDASPKVLSAGPDEASILAVREKVENKASLSGLAMGTLGSVLSMLLTFATTLLIPDDLLKLRVTVAVCGVWWIALSAFTFAWLHPRPGPPMPKTGFSMLNRWRHLFGLFKEASRYRYTFIFLICLVAYGSGFTTMLQMAVLFGQNDLCLSVSSMAIIALTVAVVAIAGMPLALLFQRKTHATNKTMVVILLTCLVPLPVWGFIGYFTADGGFGLKSAWEIYVCAAWLGFFLGALTSYSRTLFIDFIPVGREGAFFTLFFICDRISSCIGPFVIAAVTQVSAGGLAFETSQKAVTQVSAGGLAFETSQKAVTQVSAGGLAFETSQKAVTQVSVSAAGGAGGAAGLLLGWCIAEIVACGFVEMQWRAGSAGGGGNAGSGEYAGGEEYAEGSRVPLTKRELWGWYSYNVAANSFSAVAMPIFIPLLLLLLADAQAWNDSGAAKPPQCTDLITADCFQCVPGKGNQLVTSAGAYSELEQPRVRLGALSINPVSYATIVIGVAVCCQIVALVSLGPFTDYGRGRKQMLKAGTWMGASACTALLFMLTPSLWLLAGLLVIIASIGYGLATVSYNGYLPLLVHASPEVLSAEAQADPEAVAATREDVENRYSLIGLAAGCLGDIPITLVAFALTLVSSDESVQMRVATAFCGLCWILFALPTFHYLRARPGPPLPLPPPPSAGDHEAKGAEEGRDGSFCYSVCSSAGCHSSGETCRGCRYSWGSCYSRVRFFFSVVGASWKGMGDTLADAYRHHRNALVFIACYFVYADGFSTIIQVGVIFGQQDLCVPPATLAILATSVSFWAAAGMPVLYLIQRRTKWSNKTMAMIALGGMLPLPLWGLIGYFTDSFGLKQTWELFAYVGWFGLCLGPLLSYSRTLYVDLMPSGKEGAFFAIYTISDKGSSSFGPFVVAIIAQVSGTIRPTFVYIFLVMFIPLIVVIFCLDHKQGMEDAGRNKVTTTVKTSEDGPEACGEGGSELHSAGAQSSHSGSRRDDAG
ncbi:unnamed protein product [Closterium sp. NIES-54]